MAKTGSFIKLDRGLKTNTLWLEKPFSKGQAWVDLLLLAQGIEKEKQYRGQIQRMEPGTVYTSIRYLEKRWGWSRNKVYRFFEFLIGEGMIAVKGWDGRNIATEHSNGTKNETRNGTQGRNIVTEHTIECTIQRKHNKRKEPPKSPKGGQLPSGGSSAGSDRERFETEEEYLAWRNQ